jgi:hypothetical protein
MRVKVGSNNNSEAAMFALHLAEALVDLLKAEFEGLRSLGAVSNI